MKKSQLVIVGGGSIPLWGYCSSCKEAKFSPTKEQKDRIAQEASLRVQFDRHLMKVHLGEGRIEAAIEEEKGRGC